MFLESTAIEYREVEIFNGTPFDLEKRVRRNKTHQMIFYVLYLIVSMVVFICLSVFNIFESVGWTNIFKAIMLLVIFLDILLMLDSGVFSKKNKISVVTFIIDSIEYTNGNQMFVNGYNAIDENKEFKYKFKFDKHLNFSWDFFTLSVVKGLSGSQFFYCRKGEK